MYVPYAIVAFPSAAGTVGTSPTGITILELSRKINYNLVFYNWKTKHHILLFSSWVQVNMKNHLPGCSFHGEQLNGRLLLQTTDRGTRDPNSGRNQTQLHSREESLFRLTTDRHWARPHWNVEVFNKIFENPCIKRCLGLIIKKCSRQTVDCDLK